MKNQPANSSSYRHRLQKIINDHCRRNWDRGRHRPKMRRPEGVRMCRGGIKGATISQMLEIRNVATTPGVEIAFVLFATAAEMKTTLLIAFSMINQSNTRCGAVNLMRHTTAAIGLCHHHTDHFHLTLLTIILCKLCL